MKRLLTLLLTTLGVVALSPVRAQLTTDDHLTDFDFALRQVEANYAGFPSKMEAGNRAEYQLLKARLAEEVAAHGRAGYDAAGELFGWFGDRNLCTTLSSMTKYQRPQSAYASAKFAPQNTATQVDGKTYLIRVVSFDEGEELRSWIEAAAACCGTCENIIVDLRFNDGTCNAAYEPLLRAVYDRPGSVTGGEIRVSEDNLASVRAEAEAQGDIWSRELVQRMESATTEFVPMSDTRVVPIVFDEMPAVHRRVAILVSGVTAAAAEQFILDARACNSRTTVYGAEPTAGCVDFQRVREVDMPRSGVTCRVPMTRSYRVAEGKGLNDGGIIPDATVDLPLPAVVGDRADEWVCWVANDLASDGALSAAVAKAAEKAAAKSAAKAAKKSKRNQ